MDWWMLWVGLLMLLFWAGTIVAWMIQEARDPEREPAEVAGAAPVEPATHAFAEENTRREGV